MSHGPKLAYLGAAFFLAAPLPTLIALAPTPVYAYYDATPHLWGLSPIEDQQLGGILMAVEQSVLLFVAFSATFLQMLAADERAAEPLGSG
jgi:cytochrome c oxidase assembly factor CtaG